MGHYITECPIIPDPEMNLKEMPGTFRTALNDTIEILQKYGIRDRIDAGLKEFKGDQRCWLAQYIRESQFDGNPKFFVNTQTPGIIDAAVLPQTVTIEDVFIDSNLHEYGHVIEEWARFENDTMRRLIYGPFDDEEDFAEYMVDYFRYHKDKDQPRKDVVDKVISLYVKDVF